MSVYKVINMSKETLFALNPLQLCNNVTLKSRRTNHTEEDVANDEHILSESYKAAS